MMSGKTVWRGFAVSSVIALSACSQGEFGLSFPTSIESDLASGVTSTSEAQVLRDAPRFDTQLSREFRNEVEIIVNFGFDLDNLDPEALEIVQEQADWIKRHPNVQFAVTGHTDKVGSNAYNVDLGLRRAENVVAALVELGVRPDQLIAMVSEGEEHPLIDTLLRERTNRRTVTEVLGEIERTDAIAEMRDRRLARDEDDDRNPPIDDGPVETPQIPIFYDDWGNPIYL